MLQRNKVLEKEKDEYLQKYKALKQENKNLQNEIQRLKPLAYKLISSSNKLELILTNQKGAYDKARIGFNLNYKINF